MCVGVEKKKALVKAFVFVITTPEPLCYRKSDSHWGKKSAGFKPVQELS
jgi:hypothetical protein